MRNYILEIEAKGAECRLEIKKYKIADFLTFLIGKGLILSVLDEFYIKA